MNDQLQPCGDCGCPPKVMHATLGYTAYWVECGKCGEKGESRFDRATAIAWWNVTQRKKQKP